MRFGEKLKKLRQKHSISGYKLGMLTNRPRQFISNIENGHRPPPDQFLKSLADVSILEITYDELKAWALEDKYTRAQISLARKSVDDQIVGDLDLKVPLLNNVPIKQIYKNDMIVQDFIVDWVSTNTNCTDKTFAVSISDDGLSPKIETGDIIVVEPVSFEEVKNNSIYIFQDLNNNYIARIINKEDKFVYLYPLNNNNYEPINFGLGQLYIVGKALEAIKTKLFISDVDFKDLKEHFK